jgi:PadR family transcriptional regulator, regulatory protein PadR
MPETELVLYPEERMARGEDIAAGKAEPRVTRAMLDSLLILAEEPGEPRYGLEIAKAAGLSHTTIYDNLARLEAAGWIKSEWEQLNPSDAGRPRRCLYRLTPLGETVARETIDRYARSLRTARRALRVPGVPRTQS